MPSHDTSLGDLIRAAREALGWRQKDLALKISGECDATQVSRWERGEIRPTRERLEEVISILALDEGPVFAAWMRWESPAKRRKKATLAAAEKAATAKRRRASPPQSRRGS